MPDQYRLKSPVCDLLGCEMPILSAGMGGVARSELVAAVSEACGYGIPGMVRKPPKLIAQEIDAVRAHTDRPFAVNLIPAAIAPDRLPREAVGEDAGRSLMKYSTDSPRRTTAGNLAAMAAFAGQSVALIRTLPAAAERIGAIMAGAQAALAHLDQSISRI